MLRSICDDAGIGKEFACSQVGVVCWGFRCGNFTESGQMSRLVMILNWPLRGVMVLVSNRPLRGVIVLHGSVYDGAVAG